MVVHFWLFAVDEGRRTPAGGPVAVRRAQGPGRVLASRLRSVGENMGNPGIGALFGRERPHLPCAFIRRHNLCHIRRAYSLLEGSRGSLSGPAWITGRAGGGCSLWHPAVRGRRIGTGSGLLRRGCGHGALAAGPVAVPGRFAGVVLWGCSFAFWDVA